MNNYLKKRVMWITLKLAGEKRCRKKNFYKKGFVLYFAFQTAGHIPIIKR